MMDTTIMQSDHDAISQAAALPARTQAEETQGDYQIEYEIEGQWSLVPEASANHFPSRSAAARGVRQLRALGPDWATTTYRIRQRPDA